MEHGIGLPAGLNEVPPSSALVLCIYHWLMSIMCIHIQCCFTTSCIIIKCFIIIKTIPASNFVFKYEKYYNSNAVQLKMYTILLQTKSEEFFILILWWGEKVLLTPETKFLALIMVQKLVYLGVKCILEMKYIMWWVKKKSWILCKQNIFIVISNQAVIYWKYEYE